MPTRPVGAPSRRAFHRSLRAFLSTLLAGLMMVGSLVLPGALTAATAAPPATDPDPLPTQLSVAAEGGSVLAGEPGRIRVTAMNQTGPDQYNASAVVVLPLGVTYVTGSSEPGPPRAVGEPTITTFVPDPERPTETQQVLVWPNVADLPQGADLEVSFQVRVDDDLHPVGSTVTVDAGVYANADERVLPDVTVGPAGPSVTDATSGGADEAQVTVVPIRLVKTEADPEAEVYRGPDNAATYRLTVTAAPEAGSGSVVVTDLVPAQYQVTGCSAGCTQEIVTVGGRVHTRLTWDLGALAAGATRTLTYTAFIGLREITAPDGTPNGAPTRPTGEGYDIENTAVATGSYTGGLAPGAQPAFTVEDSFTVRVLDAGIVKSHAGGDFEAGEARTFSFAIRTSEYIGTSTLTLTDTIPDGLCPVVPDGTPTSGPWPAECATGGGTVTGATVVSATANPDGTFTVVFEVDALDADEDTTVSYSVYMRRFHHTGERTSAGDSFSNTVGLQTQTTPTSDNTVDTGSAGMANGSSAGIDTDTLSIAKTVWSNPDRRRITGAAGAGDTCQSAPAGEYVAEDGPLLQLGDLVCFRITVTFPQGVSTRDTVLGDFLPPGFQLVVREGVPQWATNQPGLVTQPNPAITRWLLGETSGSARFVPGGTTISVDLLARVLSVPETQPEVTGNLAKLRYTSAGGTIVAVRDDVDLSLAPPPPLSLEKLVDGQDELQVEEQDVVPFSIAVRHQGTAADGNTYPLDTVEVWDVLPPGFPCSALGAVTPAFASCEPVGGNSVVTWQLTGAALGPDNLLTIGETAIVRYNLTVPQPLSINTRHTNTAAITRYTAPNTDGIVPGGAALYPTNPVGAYPGQTKNAPEASDTATIRLAGATVDKRVVSTGENVAGNNLTGQATIGEPAVYEYSVTIPAHTSVFSGVLDDALPTSGALVQTGDPTMFATPAGATVGTGCAVDAGEFRLCSDGRLLFPAVYTNDSDADVTFAVRLPVRVAGIAGNVHGVNVDNVATFDSAPTAGGTPVRQDDDSARLTLVEPSPALAKTSTVTQAEAGQQVTYTLTATNAAGRPPLYDAVAVDCVPGDLTIQLPLAAGLTGPVAGDGSNGCPAGTQRLQWTLPAPLVAGTAQVATYTVTIPSSAAAGRQYINNAALTGTSLPGAQTGERTSYRVTANRTVTVNNPTLVKSVSPAVIVPGQEATWTITATVPQNVWLYNATFIDRMPTQFGNAAAVTGWELSCGGGDTAWQSTCVTGAVITASPASDFGVTIDEIPSSALPRTLTLTLRATLPATATSVANNTNVPNTARLRWNHTAKARPGNTAATFDSPDTLTATATTTVRHPLVTVTKAVNDATVDQGQIVTYTVTATASAAADRNRVAYNVQVVDTVPAGIVVLGAGDVPLTHGASTPSGGVWNATARTLTWTIPTLNPGAAPNAQTFTYRATLAPAANLTGAALTNSVRPQTWQSLPTGGGSYGPGTAATRSVTPQFPRINTTKAQVSPANPVYIGQEVTFRFVLTNAGGGPAASLDAVDTLPAGWSYVPGSAQVTVRSGAATPTEPSSITGQVLRWNDLGGAAVNLLNGQQIAVSYRAVAAASVNAGLSVPHVNTAVAADVTDLTGGTSYNGGSGSYVGTPGTADARIALSDVAVAKVANDDFVAGQTGTYTITVRNNGPDPATGVQVVDTVTAPAGVTVLGAAGAGWTCTPPAAGQFSCSRTNASDTLASGASWTLTVSAAVAANVADGTTIPNTVTVSSTTEDRTTANNTSDATATVRARADLSVTKTGSPSPATAGTPISWTVTLVNHGPSVSRGSAGTPIVLSDPLPVSQVSGIAIDSQTTDAGCAIAADTLRCAIGHDLAVGDTVVVTLSGTVNADVAPGSSIANTATVTPVTTDPNPGNNSGTSTTPTAVEESLTITKVITDPVPPAEPTPGETITYRLQVHNGGPSIARGVYVVDTLPAGLSFDGIVAGSGWTGTPGAGNTVRLDLAGTLGVDATATVDFRARIASSVTGGFTNTAVVSSTWRANQDDAAVTTGSNPSADLAIGKSVSPATIVAGESTGGTYTLVVTNHGPSDAAAPVTVTDLLPAGMSVRGTLPTGCTAGDVDDRVEVVCVRGVTLAAGPTPWTIAIPVRVAADVTATSLVNLARVSSPTPDPDPDNNTSTVPVGIAQRASLTVTKTASPDPVTAGQQVTWTIRVTNDGPSDAQSVQLVDPLDSRLVLQSVAPASANCTGTTTINCALGTLRPSQSVELTVVTTVLSSVPAGETIQNTATATSTTVDPVTGEPATDSGTDQVTVQALAQLTIDKQAVSATVDAGGVAGFDIVVGNTGPSDAAAEVAVTDTLPAGMTYLAASTIGGPADWSCAAAGQVVTCRLMLAGTPVTLAAGATAPVLRISATVRASEAAGTLTNTATATSPSDPTPPTDDAGVQVTTHADLGIVKEHAADAVAVAGEPFTWTLTVTNHGPSDSVATAADPIVVRDVLPDGVTFTSGGGDDTSCAVVGDQAGREIVECERTTTLERDGSLPITLVVALDQALAGTVTNTATVSPGVTPQPDVDLHPDSDDDQVALVEAADLTIAKQVLTDPVVAGQPVEWQVTVTNLGPSDSDASADDPIRVVDTLPLGVSYRGATGQDWACAPLPTLPDGREQVECLRVTTLRIGAAPAITITGQVGSGVRGDIVNTAEVFAGLTPQPSGGQPDEAMATATVTESADLAIVKTIGADIVAGATGVYRLQVTNLGPSDARAVRVVDLLPAGLSFARVLPPADGEPAWNCEPDQTDPQQVDCALVGDLAATRSVTIELEVAVERALQGDVENRAEVSSATPDPDPDNNASSVTGMIAERANLSVVKTALNQPVVGGELTYRLQVGNAGPSLARGVRVTDLVPVQLSLVSVTAPADWQCAAGQPEVGGTPVTCLLAELAAGADPGAIELVVRVGPDAFPAVSNTAVVGAATPEGPETLADNTSTVTSQVPASVRLGIVKELTSRLVAGLNGSYRIVVTNHGPTPDPGPVTVTDELPAGLTVRSWQLAAEAGSCEGSGRLLTCTLTGLQVNQSVEIGLAVAVASDASGTLVNTATVSSPAFPQAVEAGAEGEVDTTQLPFTGASLQALGWAFGLLLAGAATVLLVRRRTSLES